MAVKVSGEDINLVTSPCQFRYLMVQVLSRDMARLYNLEGQVLSCSINIDSTSNIRYTASLSMRLDNESMERMLEFDLNNYIRIYAGIENPKTLNTKWWCQGVYIVNKNDLSLSISDRTLSISLSDKMLDFTGDRKGKLYAYKTIVENNQRFDEVMENLVCNLGGCQQYNIEPIHPSRTQSAAFDVTRDNDYLIPMKIETDVGATIYDVLEKLVTVYPNWEMFFNPDGVFICQASVREDSDIETIMDDEMISPIKISDSPAKFDITKIKNSVDVWGKDGKYYGHAEDNEAGSPFSVDALGTIREVYSGGDYENIYDRYKDLEKQVEYDKELAKIDTDISYINLTDITDEELEKQLTDGKITKAEYEKKIKEKTEEKKKELKDLETKRKEVEKKISANVKYSGNDMAKEWAEYLLKKTTKLCETSTLTLLYCPFLNETGFKISYRDDAYKTRQSYLVTAIAHDVTGNTTTLTLSRYYDYNTEANLQQLDAPVISSYNVSEYTISITVEPVQYAERYCVYLNNQLLFSDSDTTLTYTLEEAFVGEYSLFVKAVADNYADSAASEIIKITISGDVQNTLITTENDIITTADGEEILTEGVE